MPLNKIKPITILMADDDEDDRLLTQDALAESRVLNELFFVEDGVGLLEYLERKGKFSDKQNSPRPGLILLDLNMPETCGLNGLLEIRNQHPNVPVVIISAETEKQNILQTISYGAVGFISKSSKIEEIATSIESIFEGNVCLPSEILRTPSTRTRMTNDNGISPEQIRSLTRKELTVLKYLTQGLANKVIAYELNISETTVKSHVSSILKKLGASNRVKVVASAANIDFNQYVFN